MKITRQSEEGGFLVITGPTASGKTAFSTLLSQQLRIEIINCDVGQFYAPLSIGTAKPDLTNVTVPHHLFDLVTTPESFSAAAYRHRAATCVREIIERGALPVFVGGSLFYIKSLFFPPQEIGPQELGPQEEIPEEFDEGIETVLLWEKLYQIDSARALAIDKNDRYRIARALTLWRRTGRLPSSCAPIFSPLILDPEFILSEVEGTSSQASPRLRRAGSGCAVRRTCLVSVTREREELNTRINTRVREMFDKGLVREVAALGPDWWQFLSKKKLIGYHEVIKSSSLLQGFLENSPEDLIAAVQQNTRNYAKRQMTFLRAFLGTMRELPDVSVPDVSVIDANLTLCDDYLYIEQIVAWAKKCMPQCEDGVNKD